MTVSEFEEHEAVKPRAKLLVVDDREDNLFSIEAILERDGYTIRTATSGRAALRILLKEEDFTLILMDVQMPDLNGFETAELIYERDKLKHIPIIFITANDHGEDSAFKGYQLGGVDYIYKPINPELLRAKVAVFADLFNKNHALQAQEQKLATANQLLEKEIQDRIASENKVNLLNARLIENISQLKATNEELERFAYVASHDLQEPLRKIILFGDQLMLKCKDNLGEQGTVYLDKIMRASGRMQLLIRNILNVSGIGAESGSMVPVDLNVLIAGVINDLEISVQQKEANIETETLPVIYGIPERLRQLFQNLIINALKFSKPGEPPHIRIYSDLVKGLDVPGLKKEYAEEPVCRIYVQDNGIGFEQKYAEGIFTLFKRLNSLDTYEGTGIGLSICRKIAEMHNGTITASGSPGAGATFVLAVPVGVHDAVLS